MPSLPTAGSCGNAPARGIWYSTMPDVVIAAANIAAANNTTRLRMGVPRQRDRGNTVMIFDCATDGGDETSGQSRIGTGTFRPTRMLYIDLHDITSWLS